MIFALLLLAGINDDLSLDAQYSPSKQIDKSNVAKHERAWHFAVPGTTGRFGFRPLVVDGTMSVAGPRNAIVALDAATGKTIRTHPVEAGSPTDRGINYWKGRPKRVLLVPEKEQIPFEYRDGRVNFEARPLHIHSAYQLRGNDET